MLDLNQLEAERKEAEIDKADLFDFYHDNWNAVIAELRSFQDHKRRQEQLADRILTEGARNIAEAYKSYE